MNAERLTREDWVLGGLALLLVIDLLFLPWFDINVTVGLFTLSATRTATETPDGWLGSLAVLALVALLVDLGVERFSPRTALPALRGSRTMTRFALAVLAAALLALKFLFHVSSIDELGFGFWAALILSAALVYVALQVHQGKPMMPQRPAGPASPAGPSGPPVV
jgi:hypothetical protein